MRERWRNLFIEKVGRGTKKGRERAKGREGVKRKKDNDDSVCKISKRKSTPKKETPLMCKRTALYKYLLDNCMT